MKRIVLAVGIACLVLAAVIVGRGLQADSKQIVVEPSPPADVDAERAAEGLAEAIRFQTVSHQNPAKFDAAQFTGLQRFLERRFPRVHATLRREVVNDFSLLYTWEGRGPGKPILLLAHLDVVPIEAGTEGDWTQPPFSGAVVDGHVWGRGALDDKGSALAILEAAELLLGRGLQPPRTVIFAFGHDEEVSGERGAKVMAEQLQARGVAPDFILDEGGALLEGLIPGVAGAVATVSMGEKGYVSVELSTKADGGHSSMPPPSTAIGVLSSAIDKLERNQAPANIRAAMGRTLEYLGPEMAFPQRMVLANLWLFAPLVEWQMGQAPQTNAAIRTTTAATMFDGGVKENILPVGAHAVVNFRILPGDTVETVVAHVQHVVDDPRVSVRVLGGGNNPTPVSDPDAPAFAQVARAVRAVFPGTVVAPSLALGATDARRYTALSPNVYRFSPMRMTPQDLTRVHGTNERIAVADYVNMIRFYAELIAATPPPEGGVVAGHEGGAAAAR